MLVLTTEKARTKVLSAAGELGLARDAELAAGNSEAGQALNDCALALYSLGVYQEWAHCPRCGADYPDPHRPPCHRP